MQHARIPGAGSFVRVALVIRPTADARVQIPHRLDEREPSRLGGLESPA